jgi:hypothetical protein
MEKDLLYNVMMAIQSLETDVQVIALFKQDLLVKMVHLLPKMYAHAKFQLELY